MIPDATTRAYTLKLSGDDGWRDLLWTTHCTVCRGVRAWGDFLLTLRGGLPPSLAAGHERGRVVLALSWLSVESPKSLTPAKHCVADGSEPRHQRIEKVMARFREILNRRKVKRQSDWIDECEAALCARIREDAFWVDRAAAFDEMALRYGRAFTSSWAADTLFALLGGNDAYFAIPDADSNEIAEAKDFVIKAGNWLSANWGSGKKSDAGAIGETLSKMARTSDKKIVGLSGPKAVAALIAAAGAHADEDEALDKQVKALKQAVGWKGRPSKGAIALDKLARARMVSLDLWKQVQEKFREEAREQAAKASNSAKAPSWIAAFREEIEKQIAMPFRGERDHIWEYAVMLDHALRRVSSAHSWIKRAEAKRQAFAALASRELSPAAERWLDKYCKLRAGWSGSEEYHIRKGALDGWDKIIVTWSKLKSGGRNERIDVARKIQADWPDDKKFGDIQLFAGFGDEDEREPRACLADDDATCVWKDAKGKPCADILKDYVEVAVARRDQRRFKVPAYCHPDPLRHPVFVDFGNSRWNIDYSALTAVRNAEKWKGKLRRAKTASAREAIQQQINEKPKLHGVTLALWASDRLVQHELTWHSKRLHKDLDLDHFGQDGANVSRADRFGRARAEPTRAVRIVRVFDQKDWNGRLQAPRRQLDRLADLIYGKNQTLVDIDLDQIVGTARKQWDRLDWLLSYSAKLHPMGPWLDYVPTLPAGWNYKKGRTGYYLDIAANKGRKGRARLQLSRLEGLRVLSVDLGERHAAACAVWETISRTAMIQACREAKHREPKRHDLFVHLKTTTDKICESGRNKGKPITKTTIYRRIGPDVLPDGTANPAPWARLDRQFLIKLQGEDRPARRATIAEFDEYRSLCQWLGVQCEGPREYLEASGARTIYPRIDEMIRRALLKSRQGLRRHADYARIAFALRTNERLLPGGKSQELSHGDRVEVIQDALVVWQGLANSTAHRDEFASSMWRKWVQGCLGGPEPALINDDASGSERNKVVARSRDALKPTAERLAAIDCSEIAAEWTTRWNARTAEWRQHLRRLRRLVLPRIGRRPQGGTADFKQWKQRVKGIRAMGGLSYSRLANIRGLYELMRAFHMRPEPANMRAGVERVEKEADQGYRFGARILEVLERLREARVKQLASRIVEAALGLGSEDRKHWENGRKRPRQCVAEPRFSPCHAVVVEDLEHYRPDQKRLRRENRRLMRWSARNVRKYIMDGCELNGLCFVEVPAAYTSRQDSRTGRPGMRCDDVRMDKLLAPDGFWQKEIERARLRQADGKATSRDELLAELFDAIEHQPAVRKTIRLPRAGGNIFVSADPQSPTANGIQADLNAAANIGLKGLLDPDWPGSWWYVPCTNKCVPLLDRTKGSLVEGLKGPLRSGGEKPDASGDVVNLWRNPTCESLSRGEWLTYQHYWNRVQACVTSGLRRQTRADD